MDVPPEVEARLGTIVKRPEFASIAKELTGRVDPVTVVDAIPQPDIVYPQAGV